jgi:hypothetical protein
VTSKAHGSGRALTDSFDTILVYPSRYCLRPCFHFCYLSDACLHALLEIVRVLQRQCFALIQFAREVGTDPREAPLDNFCNQLWLRPAGPAYEVDQPVPEKPEYSMGPLLVGLAQ